MANIRTAMARQPDSKKRLLKPQVGARVKEELLVEMKVLATRQRRRFNDLVEEAFQDLLKKYQGKKA